MGKTWIFNIQLTHKNWQSKAIFGISSMSTDLLYQQKESFLHQEELKYLAHCHLEKRRSQFLQSRKLSKSLLSSLLKETNPTKIHIKSGVFNQPLVTYPCVTNPAISISHSGNCSACIVCSSTHPMGIDIEEIKTNKKEIITSQLSKTEKELVKTLPNSNNITYLELWTAKEAISKVLNTGLMAPFELYEIDTVCLWGNHTVYTFKNFTQYKAISFEIKGNICSLVLPKKTNLSLESRIGTLGRFNHLDIFSEKPAKIST